MKHKYINATFLGSIKTGLAVYGYQVIKVLCNIYRKDNSVTFMGGEPFLEIPCDKIDIPEKLSMDYGRSAIWRRLLFYHIYSFKRGVFYSPIPEGPLVGTLKKIITLHDLIPLIFPDDHSLSYYYYRYYLPRLLRSSYRVIVPSRRTKDDVLNMMNLKSEKIEVIPNGYDPEEFYPDKEREVPFDYFLFVGENRAYKNIKRVIEAFKKFAGDYYLVIVGNMRDDSELKSIISQYGLNKRVIFERGIATSSLRRLYSHAKALVFPSLYEGFGLPALEALATGCPLITTKGSSMEEFVQDAALYVNPESIEDIETAMERVLDEDVKNEIIKKGFFISKDFTWENTARKVKKIIDEATLL